MTLIECYDHEPVGNVMACLRLQPDRVIYLGDSSRMEQPLKRLLKFLSDRNQTVHMVRCHVNLEDVQAIVAALEEIIAGGDQIVVDLSGGPEQVVLAVGLVLAGLDESARERVDVQKFDPLEGTVLDADGNGWVVPGEPVSLTVGEVIALHGGVVHPRTEQPALYYQPSDLEQLWRTVCADCRDWNRESMVLNEFESRCESEMEIELHLDAIADGISRFQEKEQRLRRFLQKLDRCGVIEDHSSAGVLRYSYRDPLLRFCAQKAGNVLETKALLEARAVKKDGKPYFSACVMSVNIDWDGVVNDPAERIPETRNEIDLILVRGMVPLFVSCKNGDVGEEELYKLHTVAQRFGGIHARKMLIITELERSRPNSNRAFLQRAKDMDIYVVEDAAVLTGSGWRQAFVEAMEG